MRHCNWLRQPNVWTVLAATITSSAINHQPSAADAAAPLHRIDMPEDADQIVVTIVMNEKSHVHCDTCLPALRVRLHPLLHRTWHAHAHSCSSSFVSQRHFRINPCVVPLSLPLASTVQEQYSSDASIVNTHFKKPASLLTHSLHFSWPIAIPLCTGRVISMCLKLPAHMIMTTNGSRSHLQAAGRRQPNIIRSTNSTDATSNSRMLDWK